MLGHPSLLLVCLSLFSIAGGHVAPITKYPYHVSIRFEGEHQCSGSIIDERHIITVYACIIGTSINNLTAVVGTNSLNTGGDSYKIQNIIAPDTSYHDIVLLQTQKNIAFNYKVTPIEVTVYDYERNGYPMMITAFKRPPSGKPFTDKLQAYEYRMFDGSQCMEETGPGNERFMCIIKSDEERVCNMDFGGAIVADNYLIGVKLPGDACVGDEPEQHLRIHYYLQGIRRNFNLKSDTKSRPIQASGPNVKNDYGANEKAFPYHVSIRYKDVHVCSGSIIDNRYILTSKKCVTSDSAENLNVIAGSNSLETKGLEYKIQEIITPDNSWDDIALLRTHNEISFDDKVQSIEVTKYNYKRNGYPMTVTAFKRLPSGKPFTDELQIYGYEIYDGPECTGKYIGDDDKYMCFIKSDRERVCNMDYGGAIVANKRIIGIKLYGDACVGDKPEVHLRVYHYLRWIRNNLV